MSSFKERPVENEVIDKIIEDRLRVELNKLPIKRRVAVESNIMSDDTQREIANRLGITQTRVGQIIRMGLRDLKIALRNINELFK